MKKLFSRIVLGVACCMLLAASAFAEKLYAPDGRIIDVDDSVVNQWVNVGWSRAVKLYALNGNTIFVSPYFKDDYLAVGWYDYPVTKLYAADGMVTVLPTAQKEAYLAVGWYDKPVVTLYADDGRTAVVPTSQKNDYLKVGWYEVPVVKLYDVCDNCIVIAASEKQAYLAVGWYEMPVVRVFAADGRTAVVSRAEKDAYLAVGWYANEKDIYQTLYAPDPEKMKTISVPPTDVAAYLACGWYQTLTEAVDAGVINYGLYHAYKALSKYLNYDVLNPEIERLTGIIRSAAGCDFYFEKPHIYRNSNNDPEFTFDFVNCNEKKITGILIQGDLLNSSAKKITHMNNLKKDLSLPYGFSGTISITITDYPTVTAFDELCVIVEFDNDETLFILPDGTIEWL